MANANNVSDKVKSVAENALDEASSIKDKVQDLGGAIKDNAADLGKEALNRVYNAQDYVVEYVKSNPYKSLGLAFVAGLFVAKCRRSE